MLNLCRTLLLVAAFIPCASPAQGRAELGPRLLTLSHSPREILEAVARLLHVDLRPEVPLPSIRLESRTPLPHFQNAVESSWQARPPVFSNAYAASTNEIFLADVAARRSTQGASLDEMLAHEMAHYIQARYWRADLNADGAEFQARQVQLWFREMYLPTASFARSGRD